MLCLSLWPDRRGDPFLYSIHFANSVGTFLAPVLAAPFLRGGGGGGGGNDTDALSNATHSDQSDEFATDTEGAR